MSSDKNDRDYNPELRPRYVPIWVHPESANELAAIANELNRLHDKIVDQQESE